MSRPKLKQDERYTYQDYLTWPDEERWEIIDGIAYDMSPAPNINHQKISSKLTTLLVLALEGKPCIPFAAPCDVVLSEEDVVQPDLLVVCDPKKITDKNVQGAPDLVIEILSPSTAPKDHRIKKALYEKFRVKEYLIVDPVWQCIYRYSLGVNEKYGGYEYYHVQEEMPLLSLPGVSLPLWTVFDVEKKEDKQNPDEEETQSQTA